MKLKPSLSRKGLALVSIPLLVQLLLFLFLASLHAQAEEEAVKAYHSGKVSNTINRLVRDMFDLAALSQGEIYNFGGGSFEVFAAKIRKDLDDLKAVVKDDPAQMAIVTKSADAGERAYTILQTLQQAYRNDGPMVALEGMQQFKKELRFCVNQMISHQLIAMAQAEEKSEEEGPIIQARFRQTIKMILIAGISLSIILTVLIATIFYREIVKRLQIMVENSYRLASELPLRPQVGGADEIAQLDKSFHTMARVLAEAKQKEKSLIEHSLDVICSLTSLGKFAMVNPACQQLFGYTEEELRGRNLSAILVKDELEPVYNILRSAVEQQTEAKFETRIQHKDGRVVDVLWSIHWVPSEKLLFGVAHDISERKEAERMKQEVVAMVSHDLRTPLATIGGYFEMLAEGMFGNLTERGAQLLKVAENSISRMLNLINDLLDIEKSKSGRLEIFPANVSLNKLIDQTVQSVSSLASKQEVKLEMVSTDLSILADGNRISQVLVNLLGNAIKFCPKQGVVRVTAEKYDDMARICVSDTGRGVPDELKEAIFERFQQVQASDAVEKGGSGLGLAICKVIVELHGGNIKVEDNLDGGSIFSFTLPLAKAEEKTGATTNDE